MLYSRFLKSIYLIKLPLFQEEEEKKKQKACFEKWWEKTYKGAPIKLSVGFSAEALLARREWDDTFRGLKEKNAINQEYYTQQSCLSEMKEK